MNNDLINEKVEAEHKNSLLTTACRPVDDMVITIPYGIVVVVVVIVVFAVKIAAAEEMICAD